MVNFDKIASFVKYLKCRTRKRAWKDRIQRLDEAKTLRWSEAKALTWSHLKASREYLFEPRAGHTAS